MKPLLIQSDTENIAFMQIFTLKSRISLQRILLSVILLTLFALEPFQLHGQSFYQYTPNGKIALERADKKLLIKFLPGTNLDEIIRSLSSEQVIQTPKKSQLLQSPIGAILVDLKVGLGDGEYSALINRQNE